MNMDNQKFINTYNLNYIKDYFIDISDLSKNTNEIVLEGELILFKI